MRHDPVSCHVVRSWGLSLQGSVLTLADGMADALGLLRRPLQVDALLALARRRSGLDEFGDTTFIAPLQRLLAVSYTHLTLPTTPYV